ncbi:hypothetical protein [Nocardioides sp. W7]|uniref:hypothetical protein n=1 Tax=Nocardioides sp. W7 TaxID=2931390 RepID=UPI001FCFB440|nr:hypothetical protein [Nocardioides sp. W7]
MVIDDDEKMLSDLSERLIGLRVEAGRRRALPIVDGLLVQVDENDSERQFSEITLNEVLALSSRRYDYIILDYSYASRTKQATQWNESGKPPETSPSNAHLLTIADLTAQARSHAARRDDRSARSVGRFFSQHSRILLRSFQHDRANDTLGTYENRLQVTRGVFRGCDVIDPLNGFAMVYNSDPDLRETMYHTQTRGRELYRVVAMTMTTQLVLTAMMQKLANQAGRLRLFRSSRSIALLVTFVAALATFVESMAGPLGTAVRDGEWSAVSVLTFLTLAGVVIGSLLLSFALERGLNRIVEDE